MNPISQIELNTHFKDLERQVASARRLQGALLSWLGALWRQRKPIASEDARKPGALTPALATRTTGA
jgi:hypothetical protein